MQQVKITYNHNLRILKGTFDNSKIKEWPKIVTHLLMSVIFGISREHSRALLNVKSLNRREWCDDWMIGRY